MSLGGSFLSGVVEDHVGKATTMAPEALDFTGAFTGGTVETVLVEVDGAIEAMDFSASFAGGSAATVLITTVMAPEAFDLAGSFVSGHVT